MEQHEQVCEAWNYTTHRYIELEMLLLLFFFFFYFVFLNILVDGVPSPEMGR